MKTFLHITKIIDFFAMLGTIGEVLSGRTSISFIGHFINDYGTDEMEYIFPYFFDKLCIVAPKAPRIPEWMAIFQCYDITVWLSLLSMNSFCGWFWFMLRRFPIRLMMTSNFVQESLKIFYKFTLEISTNTNYSRNESKTDRLAPLLLICGS